MIMRVILIALSRWLADVHFDVCEHEHGCVDLSNRFVLGQLPVVLTTLERQFPEASGS